jgi:hypothetical protein
VSKSDTWNHTKRGNHDINGIGMHPAFYFFIRTSFL